MLNKQSKNSAVWNTIAHFNHSHRQCKIDYLKVSSTRGLRPIQIASILTYSTQS